MKRFFLGGFLFGLAALVSAATFNLFSPATGVLIGNTASYITTAATFPDSVVLTAGAITLQNDSIPTASEYYGTNGASVLGFYSLPTGATGANPTGVVGLTAVNGSATTFMRSDAAPPLSQAISPTMTGNWNFTPASGVAVEMTSAPGSNAFILASNGIVPTPFGATVPFVLEPALATVAFAIQGADVAVQRLDGAAISNRASTIYGFSNTNEVQIGMDGTQAIVSDSTNGDLVLRSYGNTIRFTTNGTQTEFGISGSGLFSNGNTAEGFGTINAAGFYLNGALQTIPVGANPTGTVGLTAVNGSATTFMRSDAAPPLSTTISPTMTGNWTFDPGSGTPAVFTASGGNPNIVANAPPGSSAEVLIQGNGNGGSTAASFFQFTDNNFYVSTASTDSIFFQTNATNRLAISGTTGGVTISSPSSGLGLTVSGGGASVTGATAMSAAVTMPGLAASSAATTGTVCWTTATGNLTVDTTTTCLLSTRKVKKNITPLDSGLDEVMKLRPVSYELKSNPYHLGRQIGLVAEEVAPTDDRLVSRDAQGDPLAVRYQQLTAVLVKAIQEQQKEIVELRHELKRRRL